MAAVLLEHYKPVRFAAENHAMMQHVTPTLELMHTEWIKP